MSEKYNICLDVGGTKVLGAIFDEKDKIIYRLKKRSKSQGEGSADVEKVIIDVVEEMIKESGIDRKKLNAVASCAPGVIDQDNGIVLFTPNLPWRDYDMAGAMRKQFGVPFYVGNDVNLGVLGEYKFGAAWYVMDEARENRKVNADGKGWLAFSANGILFVKKFQDLKPEEPAPAEAEIQVYANPGKTFVEIEEQGAYTTLQPGGEVSWTVRWYLAPQTGADEPSEALLQQALAIVK